MLYARILKKKFKERNISSPCDGICQNYIMWKWHIELDKKNKL